MIKGVELRMGNWVYHGDDPKPVQYVPVYDFEDLNPIPLDEEWLKKFGYDLSGAYIHKDYNKLRKGGIDGFYHWVDDESVYVGRPLKYVHQLQNLYYELTGDQLIDVSLPMHVATKKLE